MAADRMPRCPTGCGSTSFSALRRGALLQEFTVEHGTVVEGDSSAEAGGPVTIRCECGYAWQSTAAAVAGLAMYVDGR